MDADIVTIDALINLVLLPLAVAGVLIFWFQGSIFVRWRSYFESRKGRLAELMTCPLCLAVHVAFWTYMIGVMAPYLCGWFGTICLGWIVPVLSAAFLGQSLYYRHTDAAGARRDDDDPNRTKLE